MDRTVIDFDDLDWDRASFLYTKLTGKKDVVNRSRESLLEEITYYIDNIYRPSRFDTSWDEIGADMDSPEY